MSKSNVQRGLSFFRSCESRSCLAFPAAMTKSHPDSQYCLMASNTNEEKHGYFSQFIEVQIGESTLELIIFISFSFA